jgi:hypothetical protein
MRLRRLITETLTARFRGLSTGQDATEKQKSIHRWADNKGGLNLNA